MRYQLRRCSPPTSPHRQVVVGRGRAWTEVRLRQGRDCMHQSCAAVSSACWTLAYWWASQLFFLGRLWCAAFFRAFLRLPALRVFACLGSRGLGVVLFAGRLGRPSRRRPGRASSFSCVCCRSWSSRSSCSSSSLAGASVAPGPRVLVHPGLRRFSRCFCVPGGQPRNFSDLRSSRSRRLLRGGAYKDCA